MREESLRDLNNYACYNYKTYSNNARSDGGKNVKHQIKLKNFFLNNSS